MLNKLKRASKKSDLAFDHKSTLRYFFAKMCDTTTIKDKEGELMKPIKLKELIATAKDPATQQIAIAENYTLYVVPLFEGLVKDVDKALAERILSDWRVETDSTRFIALVI